MKSTSVSQILIFCITAYWSILRPEAVADQYQKPAQQTSEKAVAEEQINDEDREIIEHFELLQNFELFLQDDLEMIKNLDIFLANS